MNKFLETGEILIIYCEAFLIFYDAFKKTTNNHIICP